MFSPSELERQGSHAEESNLLAVTTQGKFLDSVGLEHGTVFLRDMEGRR